MKNSNFKLNLKSKWVVGLSVLTSLGVCGVCLTQPHVTLKLQKVGSESA